VILKTKLFGKPYSFGSVKEVLAKANEEKSGDKLAGIAAGSAEERVAAKVVLAQLKLEDIFNNPAVPYDEDEVTRVIYDDLDKDVYESIKDWTVEDLRAFLLNEHTTDADIKRVSKGLTSEMIAAVCKLMSNLDLITASSKMVVEKTANTTIGRPGTFSNRLQPNHPTDSPDGITASTLEGLSYGSGDALIGLNPVDDTLEAVERSMHVLDDIRTKYNVPTQTCVLAHVTTQMEAVKNGAPTGLIFQSIAGSEKGNEAFGVTVKMLEEANELIHEKGVAKGPNLMYFETGQGSELSSDANFDSDQVTMEARCYGLARHYDPFLVNTVVGFIGPEYLYDSKQVTRAGLEDHFMGKLHGLPMGVDVCYTNHMKADQNDMENLLTLLAAAGCTYVMGIPHGDDVMLNYQTTGYQDTAAIREIFHRRPIKEFDEWCEQRGILHDGKLTDKAGDASMFLKEGK